MAAISILILGAGGLFCVKQKVIYFLNIFKNPSYVIIFGMILLFIAVILVFFIKPIVLTLIRWIIFNKIHEDELADPQTPNNEIARKKIEPLSENLFSELDEIDKESKEDFEKIEKIVNYQEKRKKE